MSSHAHAPCNVTAVGRVTLLHVFTHVQSLCCSIFCQGLRYPTFSLMVFVRGACIVTSLTTRHTGCTELCHNPSHGNRFRAEPSEPWEPLGSPHMRMCCVISALDYKVIGITAGPPGFRNHLARESL